MADVCGTCRGRGTSKPTGLGLPGPCRSCGGSGEKQPPQPASKIAIRYAHQPDFCLFEARVPGRGCGGILTWHHICARDVLEEKFKHLPRRELHDILADPRNLVPACLECHLGLVETASVKPDAEDLPTGFWIFVEQHDLAGDLPRYLRDVRV